MPWYEAVFRREDGDEVVDPFGIPAPLVVGEQWGIGEEWWEIEYVENSETRGLARKITFVPSEPPATLRWHTRSRR
jgi:hypothetical protein